MPVTLARVVSVPTFSATISAEAARATRFVEMMPPKLAVPALATLFCVAAEAGFLSTLFTWLMATRLPSAAMSCSRVCSGVLLAMVLLTVELMRPALVAVTCTRPPASTVAPSIRARIVWVAAAVSRPVPRTVSIEALRIFGMMPDEPIPLSA
ncbi:hypothetical protein GCM10008965_16860 [Methylorubrum aminovorans]